MRMLASDATVCYKNLHIFVSGCCAAYYSVLLILVPSSCTTGAITLVDGRSGMEGRVELCRGGVWGAVYDREWDFNDAQVTCQQLGYPFNCELASFSRIFGIRTSTLVSVVYHMELTKSSSRDAIYNIWPNCGLLCDPKFGKLENSKQ